MEVNIKCDFCNLVEEIEGSKLFTDNRCGIFGARLLTALHWCEHLKLDGFDDHIKEKRRCEHYNLKETEKVDWAERYGQAFCDDCGSFVKCRGIECLKYGKKELSTRDIK